MADKPSIIETRGEQLFPKLSEVELNRLHRFGTVREYPAGATLTDTGQPADGLLFILSDTASATVHSASGERSLRSKRRGFGPAVIAKLKERIASELRTTFLHMHSREIPLAEALQLEVMAAYRERETGQKMSYQPEQTRFVGPQPTLAAIANIGDVCGKGTKSHDPKL